MDAVNSELFAAVFKIVSLLDAWVGFPIQKTWPATPRTRLGASPNELAGRCCEAMKTTCASLFNEAIGPCRKSDDDIP